MSKSGERENLARQYLTGLAFVSLAILVNYFLAPHLGYWGLGLVFLLAIVVQSLLTRLGPTLLSALLSTLAWNFLFIPPRFTLYISRPEDALLVLVYFIAALVTGTLATQVRNRESAAAELKIIEESERLHKLLLNSLSHELRTPITAIKNAVSNLEHLGDDINLQRQMLREINLANERLNRLIENLLDVSRLESGHLKPRLEWCDLNDLINAALKSLSDPQSIKRVKVKCIGDHPLVRIDFILMEQALKNLLHNALAYSPAGSAVEVIAEMKEHTMELHVCDQGPGLDPGLESKVFERFFRAPGSGAGGLGLGLSIARGFAEAQGATLRLVSKPGEGSRFILALPLGTPPKTKEAQGEHATG